MHPIIGTELLSNSPPSKIRIFLKIDFPTTQLSEKAKEKNLPNHIPSDLGAFTVPSHKKLNPPKDYFLNITPTFTLVRFVNHILSPGISEK